MTSLSPTYERRAGLGGNHGDPGFTPATRSATAAGTTTCRAEKQAAQTGHLRGTQENVMAILWRYATPEAVSEVLDRFEKRHWTLSAMVSQGHGETQKRVIGFWAVKVQDRHWAFKAAAKEFRWTAPTQESYWACSLKCASTLGIQILPEDRAFAVLLRRQALAAPVCYPHGITPSEVADLLTHLTDATAQTCLATTYALGARFSDVSRLTAEDVLPLTESGLLGLAFRFGKVANRIGTFVVHLPLEAQVATAIMLLAKAVKSGPLFDQSKVTSALRASLAPKGWHQAQLRRGALQSMAAAGASTADLLHLSRHRSVRMLDHYLAKGLFRVETARAVAKYQVLLEPTTGKRESYAPVNAVISQKGERPLAVRGRPRGRTV